MCQMLGNIKSNHGHEPQALGLHSRVQPFQGLLLPPVRFAIAAVFVGSSLREVQRLVMNDEQSILERSFSQHISLADARTVNGEIDQLLWLHGMKETVDVVEDLNYHLLFGQSVKHVVVPLGVRAVVDNSIHVQV